MRDPAEHPVDRYLAAVARTLRLPPSLEADRLDEIAIHIDDTVASLIDEGLDRAHAEREALARLGSPEVLGDELRRAEQTARRALAAVGGGIVAAAGGVILGSIVGFLALFSTFVGGALLVQAVAHLTGWQVNPVLPVSNAGAYVSIAWLAAFLGARSAAEAIARGSRRRIVDVRAPVAVAATAVAVWVVATWQLEQDWLSVAALLALPALAAIGPFAGHDDPAGPRGWSRAWFVAAAAALLLPVVLLSGVGGGVTGAGPGVGQSGRSIDEMWHATGWDEVGRRPGDETVSPALADAVRTTGPHDIGAGSKVVASASVPASEVSDWTALRLEVWRASDDPGSGPEIDADATSPDRVVPLGSVDGSLVATVRLDDRPGARGTWAVVTGAAADGARYVLARDFAWAPFQGSVIDWITAVAR